MSGYFGDVIDAPWLAGSAGAQPRGYFGALRDPQFYRDVAGRVTGLLGVPLPSAREEMAMIAADPRFKGPEVEVTRMMAAPGEQAALQQNWSDKMNQIGLLGMTFSKNVKDYQGLHKPSMRDSGAPGHDLTGGGTIYPDDIYSARGAEYYGTREPADAETFAKIYSMRNRPNRPVTVYRAIPYDLTPSEQIAKLELQKKKFLARNVMPEDSPFTNGSRWYEWATDEIERLKALPAEAPAKYGINPGDWVTTSRAYAKQHGEGLGANYKIIKKTVKAKDIFTSGDSPHEWGYDPQP